MSNSKPLPSFTYDVVCYLNREQLEQYSIVCRPLKNIIERYFHSKPYRVFKHLVIREGTYALRHNNVYWHPNRDDYSVQQFLAGQKCIIDKFTGFWDDRTYYSFAEMRPYFGRSVRIRKTVIYAVGNSTNNSEIIAEMESIAYLWRNNMLGILKPREFLRIGAEAFQPILNSPIILQCRELVMENEYFSFKDFKILSTIKVITIFFDEQESIIDPTYWQEFLEQPWVKPVVAFHCVCRQNINNFLDRLSKGFSSAVSPIAFKILLAQCKDPLTEFRKTNNTSDEILELKEGLPIECQKERLKKKHNYTLKRFIV